MQKTVLVLSLLGSAISQYVQSATYSTPDAVYYQGYARESTDLVPAGYKISQLSVYPTHESTNDYVVAGLGFCYTQVSSDGTYNTSTTQCVDRPCYYPYGSLSYLCPTPHTLDLAADEFVTSMDMYQYQTDIALCHLGFTTDKGNYIGAGSFFANVAQNSQTFTVPAGSQLAGFYTFNYVAMEAISFFYSNSAPAAVCGDGVVQSGEQCDNPASSCCTSDCKFASAAVVCRGVNGLCDVAENCTGSSDACPADAYLPAATPCGEFFGMCDVELEKSCSGTSPQCFPTPAVPATSTVNQEWTGFNVLSFDGFSCAGGDVEGRLAARNSATLSGFTLGLELNDSVDGMQPFSLYSAGAVSWVDGSLHPSYARAFAKTFTGSDYLAALTVTQANADTAAAFDNAQVYYSQIQDELAGLALNADATLQYGDGLLITCTNDTDLLYHLAVDAVTFNQVNWYSTSGCRFSARWIIDITGAGNVAFQGEPFPGIVERVIYNVVGSGRSISANNGVAGHILAPHNSYTQTQGVTYGKVVVGNVTEARQNNKPNCVDFSSVTISKKILKPVQIGDEVVYVADLNDWIVGDRVCINGNCQIIASGSYVADDQNQVVGQIRVQAAFAVLASVDSFAKVTVSDPSSATRDNVIATRPSEIAQSSTDFNFDNSAPLLSASLMTIAAVFIH